MRTIFSSNAFLALGAAIFLTAAEPVLAAPGAKAVCGCAAAANCRPEFELKIYMLASELASKYEGIIGGPSESSLREFNGERDLSLQYGLRSLDTLALDTLERYYLNNHLQEEHLARIAAHTQRQRFARSFLTDKKFKFGLRPLESKAEHHHDSARYMGPFVRWGHSEKENQPSGYYSAFKNLERLYTLASGDYSWETDRVEVRTRGFGDDNIKAEYLVGNPHEKSVYFDTLDGNLEQMGYAARVKEWKDVGAKTPAKKQIMIKQVVGKEGPFLHRVEYSRDVDPLMEGEALDKEVQSFVLATLKDHVDHEILEKVERRRIVHTERIGIPLMYNRRKPLKIGFLSLDKYRISPLKDDYSRNYFYEIEVEIHPEYRDLIRKPTVAADFGEFVADLMKTFDGAVTDLHKHQVRDYNQVIQSTKQD